MFWRGPELCVQQPDDTKTMRCYDTERHRWEGATAFSPPETPALATGGGGYACEYVYYYALPELPFDNGDSPCGPFALDGPRLPRPDDDRWGV